MERSVEPAWNIAPKEATDGLVLRQDVLALRKLGDEYILSSWVMKQNCGMNTRSIHNRLYLSAMINILNTTSALLAYALVAGFLGTLNTLFSHTLSILQNNDMNIY